MQTTEENPYQYESLETVYNKALAIFGRLERGELMARSREYRILHSECLDLLAASAEKIEQLGLFSPNDSLDDIATNEMRYLNIDYFLAAVLALTPIDASSMSLAARLTVVQMALRKYCEFIATMLSYHISDDRVLNERLDEIFPNGPHGLCDLAAINHGAPKDASLDAYKSVSRCSTAFENSKIKVMQYPEEKITRDAEIARLQFHLVKSWETIKSLKEEIAILHAGMNIRKLPEERQKVNPYDTISYIASPYLSSKTVNRVMGQDGKTFDDVKEQMLANEKKREEIRLQSTRVEAFNRTRDVIGPDGKVNRPFVILPSNPTDRGSATHDVFGTGQKLPTMTINEVLEQEFANRIPAKVEKKHDLDDEDITEYEDEDVLKLRKWDEFRENNPRGSGNTMNLG